MHSKTKTGYRTVNMKGADSATKLRINKLKPCMLKEIRQKLEC